MFIDFHSEIFSWIRGGLFVLFIYHFLIFFQNKSKLYLYYSLYLFALSVYFFEDIISEQAQEYFQYLNYSVQFLAYAAYVAFGRVLLDSRKFLIKWDKYFEMAIKVLVLLAPIFMIIQFFLGYEFQTRAFTAVAPIITIFTLYSFYKILKTIKDSSALYFVIGSLIYVFFANVSFLELFIGDSFFMSRGVEPMFFMYFGAICQSLIFSVIIGFIIKRIEQKSKNAEVRLAVKLRKWRN